MTTIWFAIAIFTKIINVENRMVALNYRTNEPAIDDNETEAPSDDEQPTVSNIETRYLNTYELDRKRLHEDKNKPCSIVVLSNAQNPKTQALLRRYRYDANGMLIPNSVKYFIKLPGKSGSSPILVPLNDRAFSPLGGFVRYYKEVPPIPQSW